jgi:hypothetical protein
MSSFRAETGQMISHSVHETQSNGLGSHGSEPAMAKHSVGQTATQSVQPVHLAVSNIGSVASVAFMPPLLPLQDR